jgi:hypothetical protein
VTARPPSKPWRVYGARGISEDYRSQRAAYEAVDTITHLGSKAKVYRWDRDGGRWQLFEVIEAIPPEHVREGSTVGEFLTPPRPGIILGDCSCGAEYEVPQGRDEYGALEKAHREHVAATKGV